MDLQFTVPDVPSDPFGVEFGARFTGPDGEVLCVPGFYDGGTTYVVRFAPPQEGQWVYVTNASLSALAGLTGCVQAMPAREGCHGPIVQHPSRPQRLAYADGTSYYLMAFEVDWLFALDALNPDGIPQTERLVDCIADYGFNHAIMNVYAYDVSWAQDAAVPTDYEFRAPAVFPYGGSNAEPDFTRLNPAFFQRLDRVIRYLERRGIVAHLMIYVWNKLVSWPLAYSEADNRYFDYVVARYQAFSNVVWDISKEALGYGHASIDYIVDRIHRLRRGDAYQRLLTVHDYAFCARHPELVDIISIQTWRSELHHEMARVRDAHPNQPILNIEHGGYERGPYWTFRGDYVDPEVCLIRNYECVFAGSYSTYYWQDSSWNVVIPDPMGLPAAQRPHFDTYRHLATLFTRYDFADLVAGGSYASSGFTLSNERDLFMFWLPAENYALHVVLPAGAPRVLNVTWFNPFTGELQDVGAMTVRTWHEFSSPWSGRPAVLILDGR